MPCRLNEYERILQILLASDYTFRSVQSYWDLLLSGKPIGKTVLLRHDVDTDRQIVARFLEIEKRLGVQSTYYFRLSTLDIPLMQQIHAMGSEASYHYEEIAEVAKRRGIGRIDAIKPFLAEIGDLFCARVEDIRKRAGVPVRTVASHGDFANRLLGLANTALLDEAVRARAKIEVEAYDMELMQGVFRISDAPFPTFWHPAPPTEGIVSGTQVMQIIVHSRHWRSARLENLRCDIIRLWEGLLFFVRTGLLTYTHRVRERIDD